VPARAAAEFKFFILHADGTVTWEGGSNHQFGVPANGVGAINVNWQP
jgi:hypothetical protein